MGTMKTQKTHKKSLLDMLCAISNIQKYQIQINIWSGIQLRSRIVYSEKLFHYLYPNSNDRWKVFERMLKMNSKITEKYTRMGLCFFFKGVCVLQKERSVFHLKRAISFFVDRYYNGNAMPILCISDHTLCDFWYLNFMHWCWLIKL